MSTPTQTIERLEALLEKATPGEYVADVAPTPYDDEDERAQVMVRDKHGRLFLIAIIENGAFGDTIDTERCNAEAFAALKNAAPLLLALAREQQAWRAWQSNMSAETEEALDAAKAHTDRLAKETKP
jgi:hypothetical protein